MKPFFGLRLVAISWNSPLMMTWVSLGVQLLGFVVLLPLILSHLPVEEVSLWLLFSSVLAIVGLADFGFAPTFIRTIAYTRAKKKQVNTRVVTSDSVVSEENSLGNVIAAMRYVYNRLFFIALFLASVGGSLAVASPISHLKAPMLGWLAWAVVAIVGSVSLRGGMYSAYLQGINQIALYRRWEVIVGTIAVASNIIILIAGGGMLELVLVSQAGLLIKSWVNSRLALSNSPIRIWNYQADIENKIIKTVWSAAWRSGVGVLMTFGIIQGTGIAYAQLAPPEAVASYLLALRLIQIISSFANVPFYTRIPTLAKLYAEGRKVELISIARGGMLWSNMVLCGGIICVAAMGDIFLSFIGSNTVFVEIDFWLILGMAIQLERIGAMHLQMYSTTGHILWHIANGVSGAIMLFSIFFFYGVFGVNGFALGILISYALFYVPYTMVKNYTYFKLNFIDMDLWSGFIPIGLVFIIFTVNILN